MKSAKSVIAVVRRSLFIVVVDNKQQQNSKTEKQQTESEIAIPQFQFRISHIL